MGAASHYINEIRAREKNVLVIETGDILTGTLAVEMEYRGVIGGVMIEFLNRLGYDVWSYGNHDFDKGQHNAIKLSKLAEFPTVMANIVYKKNGSLFPAEPYHIFEEDGLRVGVIAVMHENFLIEVQKEAVEGLDVLPIIPTLNAYVPVLDKQTDLVVVTAHGAFDDGIRIAKNVPGIDIVLTASHDGKFEEVNGVLVKSTWGYQRTLGYLKVEVEDDRVSSYEEKLVWLWADVDLNPSPQVVAFLKEVDESIGAEFSKVLGESKRDLSRSYYPHMNSRVESELGNWITDVMRWKTGVQIAFHNNGAIRADIRAGPVTKADVFEVSPFQNTLMVFELTARQIKDILEYDVERDWDRIQVSGLRYRFYPKDKKTYGKRIDFIEVNGEVLAKQGVLLHPEKVFTVVSNDYLLGHAEDKYFGFRVDRTKDTGISLNKALMEWLSQRKVLDYKIQKRIVEIKN